MVRRTYRIQMQTPLGSRAGTMEVQIEEPRLWGNLNVLKHVEPFEGTIDASGACRIRGTLVTLMSSIPYTASGQLTPDSLSLFLEGGRNLFPVTGTVCPEEKKAPPAETAKERKCL